MNPKVDLRRYVFCKRFLSSSQSPPHLREKNANVGLGLRGGIGTPSLCGKLRVDAGEDLPEEVTFGKIKNACKRCQEMFEERELKSTR